MRDKIFICALILFFVVVGASADLFGYLTKKLSYSTRKSEEAKLRIPRSRHSWYIEDAHISNRMFYRLFRMTRPCFNKLCKKIERAVGEKQFKSEKYIMALKNQKNSTRESRLYFGRLKTVGPDVSGEWKVAIALRILAGGSYLDMFLWANVHPDYVVRMTRGVFQHWFCHDDVTCINYSKTVLQNKKNQETIREEFGSKTNGIFSGCIGALDGWLVRIRCPTLKEVANPGKYYSRKGFYGINVQVIVDKKKRILWRYIGEKGSGQNLEKN
jgi:hypothetical protein